MCETWKKRLKDDPVSWLLNTNAVTRYRTLVDLAGESPSASGVQQARRSMLDDPRVEALLREATDWLPKAPSRNSDATLSHFKLRMLADFGMTVEDEGVGKIVEVAMSHRIDNMVAARGTVPVRLKKGEEYKRFTTLDAQRSFGH